MPYDPFKHHRRSIRLKNYDYAQAGAYFVTIVTQHRECLFGEIADGEMQANALGEIVMQCWEDLPNHYANVELDTFVVMPNHVHAIVVLADDSVATHVGAGLRPAPTGTTNRHGLAEIVRAFKSFSARRINELRATQGAPVWQRNYYEHIIRAEKELERIREYITNNPARWATDDENPAFVS